MESALKKSQVLVVEDSAIDLALSRALLEAEGFQPESIFEASKLVEAKSIIETQAPDLCLIDHQLPDGSGLELVQYISELNNRNENWKGYIASIVITGSGNENLVAQVFRGGANDYITKPEIFDKLTQSVMQVLRQRQILLATKEKNYLDSVTHMMNRNYFYDEASQLLAEHNKYKEICALIYIDLDGFKEINDTFGHVVGDAFLKAAASRISQLCRNTDLAARMGGDEFVMLLRDVSRCDLMLKIDSWIKGNSTDLLKSLPGQTLKCSVGIAVTSVEDETSLDALIESADQAMYTAKQAGKNRYAFASCHNYKPRGINEGFQSDYNAHHTPPTALLKAFDTKEFCLYFQPICDAHTLNIASLEALVRWEKMPGHFTIEKLFQYITQFHMFEKFHDWLVPTLLRQVLKWQQQGCKLLFSVNVPSCVEGCESFLKALEHGLGQKKFQTLDARAIVVELPECAYNKDPQFFKSFCARLSELGISSSLDHFSRSSTQMANLVSSKFSAIKIRQLDYQQAEQEKYVQIIKVSSFLRIALECQLIAVGVESLNCLQQVRQAGADQVQGDYVGPPLAAGHNWQEFIDQYAGINELLTLKNLQA